MSMSQGWFAAVQEPQQGRLDVDVHPTYLWNAHCAKLWRVSSDFAGAGEERKVSITRMGKFGPSIE